MYCFLYDLKRIFQTDYHLQMGASVLLHFIMLLSVLINQLSQVLLQLTETRHLRNCEILNLYYCRILYSILKISIISKITILEISHNIHFLLFVGINDVLTYFGSTRM